MAAPKASGRLSREARAECSVVSEGREGGDRNQPLEAVGVFAAYRPDQHKQQRGVLGPWRGRQGPGTSHSSCLLRADKLLPPVSKFCFHRRLLLALLDIC